MSMAAHPDALPHRRPMEMPGWGITVIALALLVAVAAAGVAIGRNTAPEATQATQVAPAATAATGETIQGLADQETVALLDDTMAAWSSGDGKEAASYYTTDAVFHNDIGGYTLEGSKAIAKQASSDGRGGLLVVRDSPVVDSGGGYVSHAFHWNGGAGIIVYEIRFDGLISHQWVYGY